MYNSHIFHNVQNILSLGSEGSTEIKVISQTGLNINMDLFKLLHQYTELFNLIG